MHRWSQPRPFNAICHHCGLRRRITNWIGFGRVLIYSTDGQTFTRKMPNCTSKVGRRKKKRVKKK